MSSRQPPSSFSSDRLRSFGHKRNHSAWISRQRKRQRLLETLEARQLLAGPQLIGIQPNEGDRIVNGSVLDIAPRALTLRFDQDQEIDPNTFSGIRVTRAGDDGELGSSDDIRINAGLVTLGDTATNE